jgi:hypothetical protein
MGSNCGGALLLFDDVRDQLIHAAPAIDAKKIDEEASILLNRVR